MSVDKIARAREAHSALVAYANTATTITDKQALTMASLFPVWPDGVNEEGQYIKDQIVQYEGHLYRIEQPTVTPVENEKPGGEGMLAVYRPIDVEHAGTLEDPIPWVSGMDCYEGKYYSYKGKVYKVADGGTMKPCVWPPDTPDIWQWELVSE